MAKRGKGLLENWKMRQEAEGYDVSNVNTLEEAEHFFDNNPPKKTAKTTNAPEDNTSDDNTSGDNTSTNAPEDETNEDGASKKADE